jgi:hypothetical protein
MPCSTSAPASVELVVKRKELTHRDRRQGRGQRHDPRADRQLRRFGQRRRQRRGPHAGLKPVTAFDKDDDGNTDAALSTQGLNGVVAGNAGNVSLAGAGNDALNGGGGFRAVL